MTEERTIGGRHCLLWGEAGAEHVLIHLTGSHDGDDPSRMGETVAEAAPGTPFLLVQCPIEDWNGELSPWAAPPVFGGEGFSGGGAAVLDFLTEVLQPCLSAGIPRTFCLGGYSLAGLFALWAAYRTGAFNGIAAVSPSVWFPGWAAFAEREAPRAERIYLSLGLREEKTRNRTMAAVGDNLRRQYERLTGGGTDCVLEWNPGGHFSESLRRTAAGFGWLLRE